MKLQFYPVLWCFLLVFLGGIVQSTVYATPSTNSLQTFHFQSVSTNTSNKWLIAKSTEFIATSKADLPSKKRASDSERLQGKKSQTNSIEEISHKNINNSEVSSVTISETIPEISVAENPQAMSFFKKGLYYGIAIMLLCINLICYFLFDEKLFIYYALALTGVTTVFFVSDGLLPLIGIEAVQNPFMLQSLLLWIAVGFSALFASGYLSLEDFFPKLKFFTTPMLVVAGGLVVLAFLLESTVTAYTANFVSLSILGCYFVASVMLFNKKNYAKFYAIGALIPLIFAIDFFVLKNIGVNLLSTETTHIKVAGLIEMLILTYAIVFRMKAIKEEHAMRQTEMRIFLKRQETLNRQSAIKLMEEVYLENLIMHYDLDGLQIKLLQYISEGKDNAKIARKLKTTEQDIEELTKQLYEKLEIGEQIKEDYRLLDTQPDYLYN